MRTILPFLIVSGCAPADSQLEGKGSATGTVQEEMVGDTAAGDTSAITDTGQVPAEDGVFDGEYSGWYEMQIGLGDYSDTCEGQVSITVDGSADVQISGESECEFHGIAAEYLGLRDTYLSTVSGSIMDDGTAEGAVEAEMGDLKAISVPWEGSFEGDELSASFSGVSTLDVEGYSVDVDFAGEFSVLR